jgi:hypothetical protein
VLLPTPDNSYTNGMDGTKAVLDYPDEERIITF